MLGKRRTILSLFILSLLLVPLFVNAQLVPCKGIAGPGDPRPVCGVEHIFSLLINIFNFLLTLAAIVLLLFAITAGMRMIIFHFSEQPESELANAKLTLTHAIFGFAIVAGAMIIINTVLIILGLNRATAIGRLLFDLGIGR